MMNIEEKLMMVQIMMGPNAPDETTITTYLNAAKNEILGWRYSYTNDVPNDVPPEYEMTQIQAVINGFVQRGNDGESVSVENGIHRHFVYADMLRYIRANVIAIAGVGEP